MTQASVERTLTWVRGRNRLPGRLIVMAGAEGGFDVTVTEARSKGDGLELVDHVADRDGVERVLWRDSLLFIGNGNRPPWETARDTVLAIERLAHLASPGLDANLATWDSERLYKGTERIRETGLLALISVANLKDPDLAAFSDLILKIRDAMVAGRGLGRRLTRNGDLSPRERKALFAAETLMDEWSEALRDGLDAAGMFESDEELVAKRPIALRQAASRQPT